MYLLLESTMKMANALVVLTFLVVVPVHGSAQTIAPSSGVADAKHGDVKQPAVAKVANDPAGTNNTNGSKNAGSDLNVDLGGFPTGLEEDDKLPIAEIVTFAVAFLLIGLVVLYSKKPERR